MGKVIQINEDQNRDHLGELVRGTVEETLNQLLDAEVERLWNASRYERTAVCQDNRPGHYKRKLPH